MRTNRIPTGINVITIWSTPFLSAKVTNVQSPAIHDSDSAGMFQSVDADGERDCRRAGQVGAGRG